MYKKRNIRLLTSLASLIVLTGVTYFLLESGDDNSVDEGKFRLADYTSIDRVEMLSASGGTVLSFSGSRWHVNDSLLADARLVDVLFATLSQARPKRPVRSQDQDSIATMLKQKGVVVSLYQGEVLSHKMMVGGNEQKTLAYFMNDDQIPYIMEIPGYRVYVAGIFELSSNGWRDKYVFGFNWQNFASLVAEFPDNPTSNFALSLVDRVVQMEGVATPDTARVNNFLDAVSLLTVSEYRDERPHDVTEPPVMVITVADVGKRQYTLSLYNVDSRSRLVPGLVQGQAWAVFDPRQVRELLHNRAYFLAD